jgi:Alternative oxidase
MVMMNSRFVGYLEEQAVVTYTNIIEDLVAVL